MKKIFLFVVILLVVAGNAHARTLHYDSAAGEQSIELTDTQKTFPALHIQMDDDEIAYGAMYDINDLLPPAQSLHIGYDDKEYWVGAWCPSWKEHPDTHQCTDIPADLYNRFLTLDEVQKYITPSDIKEGELIDACATQVSRCNSTIAPTDPSCACAAGTLAPGKYLLLEIYNGAMHDFIMLLDHAIGYRIIHGAGIYRIAIDINNAIFTNETVFSRPNWNTPLKASNVQNIQTIIDALGDKKTMMFIYKLN